MGILVLSLFLLPHTNRKAEDVFLPRITTVRGASHSPFPRSFFEKETSSSPPFDSAALLSRPKEETATRAPTTFMYRCQIRRRSRFSLSFFFLPYYEQAHNAERIARVSPTKGDFPFPSTGRIRSASPPPSRDAQLTFFRGF